MKGIVGMAVGAFSIALFRLPPDSLGVVIGIMFGLLAGVPVSLLILYAETQTRQERLEEYRARQDRFEETPLIVGVSRAQRAGTLPRVIVLDQVASKRISALIGEPRP